MVTAPIVMYFNGPSFDVLVKVSSNFLLRECRWLAKGGGVA